MRSKITVLLPAPKSRTDTFNIPVVFGAGINASGEFFRFFHGTLSDIEIKIEPDTSEQTEPDNSEATESDNSGATEPSISDEAEQTEPETPEP